MVQISDSVVTLCTINCKTLPQKIFTVSGKSLHSKHDLSRPVVIIWDLFILGSAPFANSVEEPGSPLTHACSLSAVRLTALTDSGACSDMEKEFCCAKLVSHNRQFHKPTGSL